MGICSRVLILPRGITGQGLPAINAGSIAPGRSLNFIVTELPFGLRYGLAV